MKKTRVLMAVAIGFIIIANFVWVGQNEVLPFYDNAGHTNLAYIYAQILKGVFPLESIGSFLKVSTFYPPFIHIIGGVVASVFGFNYKNLQYFSVLLTGVSAVFLFLYVNRLTKNEWCGVFSAVFFIFFPHVWEQSRYFMLDLPLTTLILISLYFLEKSENFKDNKFTAFFFLFSSLAQLTKWYAFIYLAIPFVFAILTGIKSTGDLKKILLKQGIFLLIASVIVLPWYLLNLKDILFWTSFFTSPDYGDPVVPLSLKNFSYYLILLINYQVVSVQFLWFLIAGILVVKSKTKLKIYLFLQIIVIYLIFTFFIGNKNLRYLMPLLPFLAIVMGYGMYLVLQKSRLLAALFFALLLTFNVFLFTINSFGMPVPADLLIAKQLIKDIDSIYLLDLSSRAIQYKYEKSDWSTKTVVDDLSVLVNRKNTEILVVADNPNVSVAGLTIFSIENKNYLHFKNIPFDRLETITAPDQIKTFLRTSDYILLPDQIVAPIGQSSYKNLDEIRKYILGGKTRDYALIKTYNLPNKDTLYLLKKDTKYNTLFVYLVDNMLFIDRQPAVANIYLQFLDDNNIWTGEVIRQHETSFARSLKNIKTFRIDYPANLLIVNTDGYWNYDGDKQFDRKTLPQIK